MASDRSYETLWGVIGICTGRDNDSSNTDVCVIQKNGKRQLDIFW